MPDSHRHAEQTVREAAYFIWEREGRPEGHAQDHWARAIVERHQDERRRDDQYSEDDMSDEEKVLACRPDANMPALLTKDVLGG